jgi:hypothetical protein
MEAALEGMLSCGGQQFVLPDKRDEKTVLRMKRDEQIVLQYKGGEQHIVSLDKRDEQPLTMSWGRDPLDAMHDALNDVICGAGSSTDVICGAGSSTNSCTTPVRAKTLFVIDGESRPLQSMQLYDVSPLAPGKGALQRAITKAICAYVYCSRQYVPMIFLHF